MARAFLVCLFVIVPASAQEKAAKTYPPDEGTMKEIREKQKALVDAIAKLPESPFKPDVEVYAKAVEWVTRHGEYWDAKSGEKILAVLAAGMKRAEELAGWKKGDVPSWFKFRGKPVVRGYRSEIDDSVQPFSITYPLDYEHRKQWRTDIVLHGRDATLTEIKFIHARESSKPAKTTGPYVQIDIYGRGNNAYRWAGETDVHEASQKVILEEFRVGKSASPLYPTILRGFSMGGAGTWHLGLHRPFFYEAIGPGAGFNVTKGYVKNLPDPLPDYVNQCLRIYDAADYAENAFHVPVIAYAGDKDPQQAATKNIQERLKKFPEIPPITFIVGKDLEHKMPPEYMALAEAEYQKRGKPRNWHEADKKIRFVTYTAKYGFARWLHIDALERHYDRTLIEGTWDWEKPTVTTTNVRGFVYYGVTYAEKPPPKRISIDGQTLGIPSDAMTNTHGASFLKKDGKWSSLTPVEREARSSEPEKTGRTLGPIDDAFMSEYAVVKPTGTGWNSERDKFLGATLSQFAHIWDKYFRGKLPEKAIVEFDAEKTDANLVLFGDPQSNPLLAKVLPKLPITWTKDKLVVNGKSYDPATHVPVMIYPNPLSPGKYVVLNTGHTFSEKDLQGTNALLYPHLGDWAVIKPKPTAKEPWAYEVVDAGIFDEFWQFEKKK